MDFLSLELLSGIATFVSNLICGRYHYVEDVAVALDDLASLAWGEVRSSYPNSLLLEEGIADNNQ